MSLVYYKTTRRPTGRQLVAGVVALSAFAVLSGPLSALAAEWPVAGVTATLQTLLLTEADADADADDPAIYVDARDPARSLVVTAVKNGGIRVYGLDGKLIQSILPIE